MRMFRIGLFILVSVLSKTMTAQSITWQLMPTDYSSITRFGPDLYQVTKDGQKGLIRSDGTMVVPLGYDQISEFYEHRALVIKNENSKERVLGVLTDEGKYTQFSGIYYTLAGQGFYSDGMLSVANAKGDPGYLNERGVAVLGFDGKWDKIKPFTEGHAAVFKNKKYMLIDKEGTKATFIIGVGEVYGGRNVYQGKAYIYDTDGKFYTYDTATKKCQSCKAPTNSQQSDYLYCFSNVTGRGKTPPYMPLPPSEQGLSPTMAGGLYGYSNNNKTILPPQFDKATKFEDGLAVACLQGKYGILKYVNDETDFSLAVTTSHFEYSPGASVDCAFQLTLPATWNGKQVNVTLTDQSTGEETTVNSSGDQYSFRLKPQEKEKSYEVSVIADGLNLWKGQIAYTFKKKEENLRVHLALSTHHADENDRVPVVATVTNAGDEAVTATITMTGSPAFNQVSRKETIPASSSIQISSYFTVKKDLTDQYVSVTTSKGGHASKTGLSLSAFY